MKIAKIIIKTHFLIFLNIFVTSISKNLIISLFNNLINIIQDLIINRIKFLKNKNIIELIKLF